jgi:hypothetical protein
VLLLAAMLVPAAVMARDADSSRYLVIFDGEYALDGSYALGSGYALADEYALDDEYALAGGYALGDGYALAEEYALTGYYALAETYALASDYALYALDGSYALANEYALYALYALDDVYALTGSASTDDEYALAQDYALSGIYALGENYALARDYALSLIAQAGGTVTSDLSRQIGVMVVDSKNAAFADTMRSYALVAGVAEDLSWKQFPTLEEAIGSGQLTLVSPPALGPATGGDPLTSLQWDMNQIRAPQAQQTLSGSLNVRVGVLDTGIDGNHLDFVSNGRSNVDCASGADFTFEGPGIGIPAACVDNHFHGTHVAGTIAARANGHGIVGVAPNVTLVPIKVCGDPEGFCYFSNVVEGITYAGDLALDVINMSFFVDDDEFHTSTEFKCASDPTQLGFREAVQRALDYARGRGVTAIAALGNSDKDLANPPGGDECQVVPSMSEGVVGVAALGPDSEKSSYSNWGAGWTDVAAPGGNGNVQRDTVAYCTRQVVSTIPGNLWACFQGTSMASPHAAGVAALISSRIGGASKTGDWRSDPSKVALHLERSAIDIGLKGDDECFGMGRIDALRAVNADFTRLYYSLSPLCPEYSE